MENKNDMFNKTPKSGKPKMFRFNLYWMYGLILHHACCPIHDK